MDEKKFNRLLQGVRARESCFRRLYEFYYPKIVFYVKRHYGYEDISEDVAQEFFRALLGDTRLPAHVKSPTVWVMRCCDNIAARMLSRAPGAYMDAAADVTIPPDPEDRPELLRILDETTARIIVMHACEGYGLNEIAEVLGIGYDAVRQRYSRGLKRLRAAEKSDGK